ncbi:nuclear receptor 2C2-associated protein isoform X1 [Calypte anna]|uniref:nuclear receptor 2C2-associated protein isoform X1 n=1 Tax=Calypte anna TaxID=9244 RepID=UPI0011C42990|nr:nuclear receptor 2C2-associated protein isoform X1 [Calypte anna]
MLLECPQCYPGVPNAIKVSPVLLGGIPSGPWGSPMLLGCPNAARWSPILPGCPPGSSVVPNFTTSAPKDTRGSPVPSGGVPVFLGGVLSAARVSPLLFGLSPMSLQGSLVLLYCPQGCRVSLFLSPLPDLLLSPGRHARGALGLCRHGHAGELRAEPGCEAVWEAAYVRRERGDLLELRPGHVPVGHPGFPPPCQGLPAPHPVPGRILQQVVHLGRLQSRGGTGEKIHPVPPGCPCHADRFQVEEMVLDKLKITFEDSMDFFGRIVVYHLGVLGERL